MTDHPEPFVVAFNGRHVEVRCDARSLVEQVRARVAHLIVRPDPGRSPLLSVTFSEPQPSWIEVRDSTGRCERGSFEHAFYHVRKWITDAFIVAHPDLFWLHAAAATRGEAGILLAGSAGAGKSTLLVRLLDRGWKLLADDGVGLVLNRLEAVPLAFTPEVRQASQAFEDPPNFLARLKSLRQVGPDRVRLTPAAITAIVFPEYAPGVGGSEPEPLAGIGAAEALAAQCLSAAQDKRETLTAVVRLAGSIPCRRLRYADPDAAADLIDREPVGQRLK